MEFSRRELLESICTGAVAATPAGYTATAMGFAANETITIGCIGTGGPPRGRGG